MADEPKVARNPIIIPDAKEKLIPGCPYCKSMKFDGWGSSDGTVTRKCRDCKQTWSGGIPHVQIDPRIPMPPDYVPPSGFEQPLYKNASTLVERTRPVDMRPEFRKGLPISDDEEL